MTKEQFKARAQNFAEVVKQKSAREKDRKRVEEVRTVHLEDVRQFDHLAAELERKYFDARDACYTAELVLGEHYASRIEK